MSAGDIPRCGGCGVYLYGSTAGHQCAGILQPLVDSGEAVRRFPTFTASYVWVDTLQGVLAEVYAWQAATFPQRTQHSVSKHLEKEAAELHTSVKETGSADHSEVADVLMLAFALANLAGIDPVVALRTKLEANKLRTWGVPDADGVVEHIDVQLALDTVEATGKLLDLMDVLKEAKRKHRDCVASMCGHSDCGNTGPCYVSPCFLSCADPACKGCR